MTLKYGHVKLNEYDHHAKFEIYHIYGVWENSMVKVFDKPRHLIDQKRIISLEYFS